MLLSLRKLLGDLMFRVWFLNTKDTKESIKLLSGEG
jgi:hypothetical protein